LDHDRLPIIAIPARNEARMLPRLVASLAAQDWLKVGRRLDVVVVLNNCTDTSLAVLQKAAAGFPALRLHIVDVQLDPDVAHVGTARRLALESALALGPVLRETVLITTDADAIPARDWVSANLSAIAAGADLVGGLIVGDREEELLLGPDVLRRARIHATYEGLADRLAHLIDPQPHDAWPRHNNHLGGSLAVRGEVYAAVGGLPALPTREDLAFVSRVRAAGYRLRHAPEVRVTVSARLHGRAPGGMAACLRTWVRETNERRPLLVEAADAVSERLQLRRRLRDLGPHGISGDAGLGALLGLSPGELHGECGTLTPAALIERLTPETQHSGRFETAEQAIGRLQDMISAQEGQRHAA